MQSVPRLGFGKRKRCRRIKLVFYRTELRQERVETPIRLRIDHDSANTFRTSNLQSNGSPAATFETKRAAMTQKLQKKKWKLQRIETRFRTYIVEELEENGFDETP